LQGFAEPAFLGRILYSGLLRVAPYCVPGGIRVVSGVRGLGAAAFADQIRRVRLRRSMSLVSSALRGAATALRPGLSIILIGRLSEQAQDATQGGADSTQFEWRPAISYSLLGQ